MRRRRRGTRGSVIPSSSVVTCSFEPTRQQCSAGISIRRSCSLYISISIGRSCSLYIGIGIARNRSLYAGQRGGVSLGGAERCGHFTGRLDQVLHRDFQQIVRGH